MPTENNNQWTNQDDPFFADYFTGAAPVETPYAGASTPESTLQRRILNLLFVIDVSGSMRGERIGQVNYALEDIFKELRNREDLNSQLSVGLMTFCDRASWLTPHPIPLEDYAFTPIKVQPYFTYYGNAFLELERVLHRSAFMNPDLGEYYAPVILFITDGEPLDVNEYPKALETLKRNKWFAKSAKYAIAVGEESKNSYIGEILAQFTGQRENVRYADEGAKLCELIEYIAVRASEVQTSVGSSSSGKKKGKDSIFDSVDSGLFGSIFSGV